MSIDPNVAANWVREVAIRQRNLTNLPLHEAAPIQIMHDLIRCVEAGLVSRVVAKSESDALFAKARRGEL